MAPIRIAIADDHSLLRDGLRSYFKDLAGFEVLIEAGSGSELLDKMSKRKIDVVIIDVSMPDKDGIEVTKIISRDYDGVKVLGLSVDDHLKTIHQMIRAGAKGYLLKGGNSAEIAIAVKTVFEGGVFFSSEITFNLFDTIEANEKLYEAEKSLTEREKRILNLVFNELTSIEIAEKMNLAVRTVDMAKKDLMDKLGVKTPIGLVKYALKMKLVSLE